MIVVEKNGIAEDIDGEVLGEQSQSLVKPLSAMGIIISGMGIDAAEKTASDDPVVAVINTSILGIKDFTSPHPHHGLPFLTALDDTNANAAVPQVKLRNFQKCTDRIHPMATSTNALTPTTL